MWWRSPTIFPFQNWIAMLTTGFRPEAGGFSVDNEDILPTLGLANPTGQAENADEEPLSGSVLTVTA
jgi:hypothetical protein